VALSTGNLTVLWTFASNPDGANPYGGTLLGVDAKGNPALLLTTLNGGNAGYGAIVQQTP
jgi:hypothetical protein